MIDRSEIKSIARDKIKGKKAVYVISAILMVIITLITFITIIGPFIILGPLTLGLTIVSMKIARGEEVEVVNLFDGFKNFFIALAAFLKKFLYLFLWYILFIPIRIVKYFSYSMTYYIIADNPGMTSGEAITKSRYMMDGHKLDLFMLELSFIGWYLLCIFTFGIALIYVAPYVATTKALFYEKLKEQN
ncbi:MAG: DUF975 family protein [bacterium]